MKNLAIITARSGSKGLPDKNIKLLCGKPMIWYSITAAEKSGCFREIMVATDSEEYKRIALSCGATVPFLRSAENSDSNASSWDAVREVLEQYEKLGETFDTVTLLQPTSPLRTFRHIQEGYECFAKKSANAVIGVVPMEHSPLWSNTLSQDGNMNNFIRRDIADKPRQKLDEYYRINGALYIVKTDLIRNDYRFYDEKCYAYIMNQEDSIDIDTEFDFEVAELLMKKRQTEK